MTSPIGGGVHGGNVITPNPCASLKKITPIITSSLNDLYNDATHYEDGGEYGYSFQNNATGVQTAPVMLPHTVGLAIGIPTLSNCFGGAHTHTDGTFDSYAMFSWNDVWTLYKLYKNTNPNYRGDVVFMLVNPSGNTYAIKIDNFQIFQQILQAQIVATGVQGEFEDKMEEANVKLGTIYRRYQNNLEMTFLNYFKSGGMSLYKSTGNDTGWKKLSLPSNPNAPLPIETPCN